MVSLTNLLETAAAATAKAEFQHIASHVQRLRATLDAYEQLAWKHAERKVIERVFSALGADVPADGAVPEESVVFARTELSLAMTEFATVLDIVEKTTPSEPSPVVIPRPPIPLPPVETNADDVEHAKRLLKEIDELRREDLRKHNAIRLRPLLQAMAAEARMLVERLPEHDPHHRNLIERFHTIVQMKSDAGVADFILGLASNAKGDWAAIARENRRTVSHFDVDVAEAIAKASTKPVKVEATDEPEALKKYPRLVQYTKEHGPLLLIGGLKIDSRIDQVSRDFGFVCEWVEIPKSSPRIVGSTTARIASGKIGVVVILEHFMGHPVCKALMKACQASNVTYATAGKGGKGALDLAFMVLEGKLPPQ